MLIDIHAKSSLSTGVTTSIETVLQRAKDAGLDGVLVAETLSTSQYEYALTAGEDLGIKVFIGVEIPTDRGALIGVVPTLDQFYKAEEWRRLSELKTPPVDAVIDLFEKKGGAIVATKPYDMNAPTNMGDHLFTTKGLHAVEVFNPCTNDLQDDFALEASTYLGLSTVGGSDTRQSQDTTYATLFVEDIASQQEFVTALRESECWAVVIGARQRDQASRRSNSERRSSSERRGGQERGGRSSSSDRRNNSERRGDRRGGDRRGSERRGGDRGGKSRRD